MYHNQSILYFGFYMKPGTYVNIVLPLLIGTGLYIFRTGRYSWFAYSLPDGLWLYSFIAALNHIWQRATQGLIWIAVVILFSFLSEIAQLFHLIPGTFDPGDLLAYGLGAITAVGIQYLPSHNKPQSI